MRNNLICRTEVLESNDDYTEERTGLHDIEFIETRRLRINTSCETETGGTVNVLNLVDGAEAVIESQDGKFEPFTVHYAETFIIPARIGKYRIRSADGEQIAVVKASVRI